MEKLPKILFEMIAGGASPGLLFHEAMNGVPVGVAVLDLDGKIQFANQALCRITGYQAQELAGRELAGLQQGAEAEALRDGLARLRHGLDGPVRLEVRQTRKDGAPLWLQITLSLLRDERGKAHAGLAILEDVTLQHRSEDALHATESMLRRTEKLAAAGRLAASVAHEINNPLEAVGNLLYLALHEEGIPPKPRRYLQMANDELLRVSVIVSQTLGFYRESATPQPVDMAELVNEVLVLYQRKLDMRQIRVTRNMEPAVVEGIPGELRQVIANLLSNAVDEMEPYGVLGIEVRADGDEVRISVSDTGGGIPRAMLERIFEPFFTTKKERGTGLGLWVSKSIVEKHGGRLEVSSSQGAEDHGTSFSVTLPRRAEMRQSA
jgi:PAS domain S-box-containing protein